MENKETNFRQVLFAAPSVLQQRFLKHQLTALAVAALTIILMIYFKTLTYCVGFLIALYVAYLGLSIIWDYGEEKIVSRRMVCIKAQRRLNQERMCLILRLADGEPQDGEPVRKFYISAPKKEISLLTPNTVMEIYFRKDRPTELLAWEIVDYTGNK